MSDTKTLFDHTEAVFLDPQSCGSSMRCSSHVYIKNGKLNINSFVELKDCTRSIEWSGYGAKGTLEMEKKLTVAIKALTNLRGAVRDAGRAHLAASRQRTKKKNASRAR